MLLGYIKRFFTLTKALPIICFALAALFYYTQNTLSQNNQELQKLFKKHAFLEAKKPTPSRQNLETTQESIDTLQSNIKEAQNYKHFFTPLPKSETALILDLQEYQDNIPSQAKLFNIKLTSSSLLGFESILKHGHLPQEYTLEDLFILKTITCQAMNILVHSYPQEILSCSAQLKEGPQKIITSHLHLKFSGNTYTLRTFLNHFARHSIPMYISDIKIQTTSQNSKEISIIENNLNIFDIDLEFANTLIRLKASS